MSRALQDDWCRWSEWMRKHSPSGWIPDALKLHPMVIWPSRYHADGTSKARPKGPYKNRGTRKSTYTTLKRKVKKSQAQAN
jgi:hypothetical protein